MGVNTANIGDAMGLLVGSYNPMDNQGPKSSRGPKKNIHDDHSKLKIDREFLYFNRRKWTLLPQAALLNSYY